MDPVSVFGLVGSIITIADVVAKSIRKLSELRTKHRNAPMQITTLIGQLYIIKAVIEDLKRWKSHHSIDSSRYHELALQVEQSLECFCPMILSLQQYLENMEAMSMANSEQPDIHDRLSYLWNESDIALYMSLVDRQVNALNLFFQAIQCATWAEQQKKMEEKDSQEVLQVARDCTSSVLGVADQISFISENSKGLSIQFDFDSIVLGSRVYQSAHRSHVKKAIISDRLNTTTAATEPVREDIANREPTGPVNSQVNSSEDKRRLSTVSPSTPLSEAIIPRPHIVADYIDATVDRNHRLEERSFSDVDNPVVTADKGKQTNLPNPTMAKSQLTPALLDFSDEDATSSAAIKNNSGKVMDTSADTATPGLVSKASSSSTYSKETLRSRLRMTALATLGNSLRRGQKTDKKVNAERLPDSSPLEQTSDPRVLLLGTSESGKSTVLKVFQLLFAINYTENARRIHHEIIFSNIIQSTRVVLEAMESLELSLSDERLMYHAQTIFMQPPIFEDDVLPAEIKEAIYVLWQDRGFLECYRRRTEYQLNPNAVAFARDVSRIGSPEYLANTQDMLRSRVKTTGITETFCELGVNPRTFYLYDVGGTRSERKKWIHVFPNATTIIFTVDATCYCKRLFEDETVNRLQEALDLFDSIANSRWFPQANILLIFTHLDQLDEMLRMHPAGRYFTDFAVDSDGPWYSELYLRHIEYRFRSLINDEEKRQSLRVITTDLINGNREWLVDSILEAIG